MLRTAEAKVLCVGCRLVYLSIGSVHQAFDDGETWPDLALKMLS